MAFIKLDLKNNWEYLSYTTEDGKWVEVPEGNAQVKWPDGQISTESIVLERYSASYSDMGQTHNVSGRIPVAEVNLRGLCTRIRLHKFAGIDSEAVKVST